MKSSLISCLLIFSIITANAQLKPLSFSMAVKADNTSQKELYKRGKYWFSNTFDISNKKMKLDNPGQGMLVYEGTFPYSSKVQTASAKTKGTVEYQVKLYFKEGRYQYDITDFKHKGFSISFGLITEDAACKKEIEGVSSQWKNQVWADIKAQAKANAKAIAKSLINEISQLDPVN